MAALKFSIVDEDYQPPELPAAATAQQKLGVRELSIAANGIKEGRKRQRIETEAVKIALAEAHVVHVAALRNEWGEVATHRASSARWQAAFVAALFAAVVSAGATYAAVSSGMFSIVAADRARQPQAWQPPSESAPQLTTHAPGEPGAGYDHNPVTGRRLAEPASAP